METTQTSIDNKWTPTLLAVTLSPMSFSVCSSISGCDGSSALSLHALRHGLAAGLLEAPGERSPALVGERAHWTGAGCQWVRRFITFGLEL